MKFLSVPWKIRIAVVASLFVTFAGRFTDDETWDVVTGSGMSILTYLTAPWAIGVVYQVVTRRRAALYLVIAIALCLFSSSWFYDGYLLLRDGRYTQRWAGNLILSPIIYLSAGLLWNLEAREGGGVRFSFVRRDWPAAPLNTRFQPIAFACLPFVLVAAYILVGFVGWHF
jgi:hypothetical protein